MKFWTLTKTALALVSIGILLEPPLRRLGYLAPREPESLGDLADAAVDGVTHLADAPIDAASLPPHRDRSKPAA